ncbi:hypothetical protein BpHYR1_045315 [Brachionus plicatilis]|uniref:Uncharacterized protein n=1 Tax=Brachionus plicatilis TaxID=10195 RepID=A0A3M7PI54_BRAPC|nr:hypothetical protein BpHYR1_045315 [Brachionus plicatilis]
MRPKMLTTEKMRITIPYHFLLNFTIKCTVLSEFFVSNIIYSIYLCGKSSRDFSISLRYKRFESIGEKFEYQKRLFNAPHNRT